ncbi:MAG: hypothetical protein J6V90_01660 [Treponema sp.]|nr:hypothetical protein [Treponema sp.]
MKKILSILLLSLAGVAAYAQSAEKISQIVESQELTFGQAAYLALAYSGDIEEDVSEAEALEAAVKKNWIKNGAVDTAAIKLSELSALYLKATGIKGGLFYRVSGKSGRYAFKELKARNLLDKAADPAMTITGQNALSLFNSCVKIAEGSK